MIKYSLLIVLTLCSILKTIAQNQEPDHTLEKRRFYSLDTQVQAAILSNEVPREFLIAPKGPYLPIKEVKNYLINAKTVKRAHFTKKHAPFNALLYDKVIAYDFDFYFDDKKIFLSVYDQDGHINPCVISQRVLDREQVIQAIEFLTDSSTYGGEAASCFVPNMSIIFYLDHKITMNIDICLRCNFLRSEPKMDILKNIQNKESDLYGFSEEGRASIIEFSKMLKMRYGELRVY